MMYHPAPPAQFVPLRGSGSNTTTTTNYYNNESFATDGGGGGVQASMSRSEVTTTAASAPFNASTRLTDDYSDLSQANLTNMQFQTATLTPIMTDSPYRVPVVRGLANSTGGNAGPGLGPRSVRVESSLVWSTGAARAPGAKYHPGENPRPYLTVPYMGRGSVNIAEDDAVRRGEYVHFPDGARQPTQLALREPAKRDANGVQDTYNDPANVPNIRDKPRNPAPVNTMRGGEHTRAEYATRSV